MCFLWGFPGSLWVVVGFVAFVVVVVVVVVVVAVVAVVVVVIVVIVVSIALFHFPIALLNLLVGMLSERS